MADCFWTDFVRCAEDCSTTPPATGPAVVLWFNHNVSGNGRHADLLPVFGAGNGPDTPWTRVPGTLELNDIKVYEAPSDDNTGCAWPGVVPTTDPALVGTTVQLQGDYGDEVDFTWGLVSDMAGTLVATGTGVAMPAATDGFGGSMLAADDLFLAIGSGGSSPYLLVATLHNVDTGDTWEATCAVDACY